MENVCHSHCRVEDFANKECSLKEKGFNVIVDYIFKNFTGEDFVRYVYYPKGIADVNFSPVKKSNPAIDRLRKDNIKEDKSYLYH